MILELISQDGWGLQQELIIFPHEGESRVLWYLLIVSIQNSFLKFVDIVDALLDYIIEVFNRLSN